tara:strand:- start:491 stop:679 length:189 start_codon:yes stop_codon:yes gene_type:complete
MSNVIWDNNGKSIDPQKYGKGEFERLHLCTFECEPLTDKEKSDIEEFKTDEREYFRRINSRL